MKLHQNVRKRQFLSQKKSKIILKKESYYTTKHIVSRSDNQTHSQPIKQPINQTDSEPVNQSK